MPNENAPNETTEKPSEIRDRIIRDCLAIRGIEPGDECIRCGGWGVVAYGSTATWRGGIGGQMFTNDVCNLCWGSGSNSKHWPSHRNLLR